MPVPVTLITPEIVAEADKNKTTALALKDKASTVVIRTEAEAVENTQIMTVLHARWKALDDQRMAIKRPMLDATKALDELFREPLAHLLAAKSAISRSLGAYRQEEQAKRDAILVASRVAMQTSTPEQTRALIIAGTEQQIKIGGARESVSFVVTITDANAIPREFCTPSERLIEIAAALADKNGTEITIPGCTVKKEIRMVPTGR